ncbi:hypothetical protein RDABS01_015424, partial [Bienertia sinuspersici]
KSSDWSSSLPPSGESTAKLVGQLGPAVNYSSLHHCPVSSRVADLLVYQKISTTNAHQHLQISKTLKMGHIN